MRRATLLLVGVATTAVLSACSSSANPAPSGGLSALESSRLETVTRAEPPPKAKFTRTMFATSQLDSSTLLLDRCRGPVAIDLGADRPVLVAEHDYCGGSAWIPRVRVGDAVTLKGHGVVPGTYVVTELKTERRGEARVNDLPAGDVVLQTCISPGELVLVAADRYDPVVSTT